MQTPPLCFPRGLSGIPCPARTEHHRSECVQLDQIAIEGQRRGRSVPHQIVDRYRAENCQMSSESAVPSSGVSAHSVTSERTDFRRRASFAIPNTNNAGIRWKVGMPPCPAIHAQTTFHARSCGCCASIRCTQSLSDEASNVSGKR